MFSLCVCVKLLYVKFVCVKLLYVRLLYVKFVCEIVVVCEGGGGRRRRSPGYRIKNKNPTQSCGEKQLCFWRTYTFLTLSCRYKCC